MCLSLTLKISNSGLTGVQFYNVRWTQVVRDPTRQPPIDGAEGHFVCCTYIPLEHLFSHFKGTVCSIKYTRESDAITLQFVSSVLILKYKLKCTIMF